MTRATTVRAVLALAVLAVSGWLVATRPPNLGLDLRGGTQIVLETKDGELAKANADTTDEALEVLRRRVDQLGVSEPSLARSGERRIIVELPGVTDPEEAVKVLGRTAQLTFHPVLGLADPAKSGSTTLIDEDGRDTLELGPAAIDGALIEEARAVTGQLGERTIDIEFRGRGPGAWQDLTGKAACAPVGDPTRRVAIVLDGKIISSPQVNPDIACDVGITGGRTSITGQFTADEAKDLALLVRAGGLPVPVEVIEQRIVGPSLGAAAIEASARAAVIGLIATILFIIAVYRLVGGLAAIALVAYGLISYAALLAIGATLTLPGLAGFVLAIGIAVDANVLVFERAREEHAEGRRSLSGSMTTGFKQAWSAIIDSNITTLLAAGLLFFLAAGPVRGFGVTLSIGVVASMFTALVLTRVLTGFALRRGLIKRHPKVSGLAGIGAVRRWLEAKGPDLMGRRRLWMGISAGLVVVALAGILVRDINWGVEFTGGRLVEYSTTDPVSVDKAREAVGDAGLDRAVVNASGDGNVSVRSGSFSDADESRVRAALAELGGGAERIRDETIGPSLGVELRNKALIALGVALLVQLAYLAIRFRWQWALATVLALAHDVILLVGAFAWFGRPVDGVFLAAVLTVIGYSVNDTVVVFDRVRELVRNPQRRQFATLANLGCLQTVPRTVNTGLGALFVLVALAVLGRDSLVDFAVALLIGIIAGTYSSVFLAAPLAIVFESRPGGLVGKLAVRASVKTTGGRAQQRRRAPTRTTPAASRKG
ncbi:protein translocase subunit SecD [Virgisporangium aurantiacum]|uniref:Multifunctional fusion protein n=1 Tax=Virgisporangium aurantiacum TaxID=175570 RepID=A0A8J3YZZ1_9ACTN|nr:protein translocase subunit SecD [Virgisporangium aurantiacum]GIJ52776.1 protein translocase subunit SecDF [Virgisporangium aurantiacum]